MKTEEVSEKFNINIEELRYYESVGLLDDVKINDGIREYEDKDIKILSKVITLKNLELNISEISRYIKLMNLGLDGDNERIKILNKKRNILLDEIHDKQKNIDCLDYIIYEINKNQLREKKQL